MKHFSIVIPTLNEADNIAPLLAQIALVTLPLGMEPEIIFVDDGSDDGTRQNIQKYTGNLNVRLICRDDERGLSSAVVAGARAAVYEAVVVMDGDLSHPPSSIPALVEPLISAQCDMVIGSRYVDGGTTPDWPAIRRFGSRIASIPARLLTAVRDPLAGFFAARRDRLMVVSTAGGGFKIGLELLAEGGGNFHVQEVPISFRDRYSGTSKMNVTVLQEYIKQLWRLAKDRFSIENVILFVLLGLLGGVLDSTILSATINRGVPWETGHIGSFLIALHTCFLLSRFLISKGAFSGGSYFRFLTITLLGLFIRGGLFALPPVSHHLGSPLFIALTVTSTCLAWLAASLISRLTTFQIESNKNWRIFAALLVSSSILLRLSYLGSIELIQEEAYYWNYSRHLAAGYLDHPPVVALLIRTGTILFGHTEFGVRFGAFLCWLITASFSYRLTESLFDRDTALRSLVLVAVLPIFFGVGLVITPDAPLTAAWAGALYFLYQALAKGHGRSWYGAGICIGVGLASKYTIVFLGPAVFIFMVINPEARRWFLKPQPYLAALLACLLFSPVIWWNHEHNWASFLFQSQGRFEATSEFSTHELLASIFILLSPTGFFAAFFCMRPYFRRRNFPTATMLCKRWNDYSFCLVMALVPLLIFTVFSFTKEVKLNWTGPLWLSILPLMAYGMVSSVEAVGKLIPRIWPKTLVSLLFGYGLILHYSALGLPAAAFSKGDFLFGWDDLARQVEEEVEAIKVREGESPLIVGMDLYKMASGLAFYRYKHLPESEKWEAVEETTGRHLFGHKALMYGYWHHPIDAAGRSVLVVSPDRNRLAPAYFSNHYKQLGEIHEVTVKKRGKNAGYYYYRLLTCYTPTAERLLARR